jgi:hypothetical protein
MGVVAHVDVEPAGKRRRRPAAERNGETVYNIIETACSSRSWLDRLKPLGEHPPGADRDVAKETARLQCQHDLDAAAGR